MKREDVEALLAVSVAGNDEWADVVQRKLTRRITRELCRAWLALDGGLRVYVGRVYDCDAGEDRGEILQTLPEGMIGFVRIVHTPNTTEGEE